MKSLTRFIEESKVNESKLIPADKLKKGVKLVDDATGEEWEYMGIATTDYDEVEEYDESGMMNELIENEGYDDWMIVVRNVKNKETAVYAYGYDGLYLEK